MRQATYLVVSGPYLGAKVAPMRSRLSGLHYRVLDGDLKGRWARLRDEEVAPIKSRERCNPATKKGRGS